MAVIDWLIVGIFLLSSFFGLWRGLVREVFSLLAWFLAFMAARWGSPSLATFLSQYLDSPQLVLIIAYASLFFIALLLGSLIASWLSRLTAKAGLSISDRLLGMFFGAARGLLILVVLHTLAQLFSLDAWLQDSQYFDQLAPLSAWVQHTLAQLNLYLLELNP